MRCETVQNACMTKNAALTVRLPASIKARLETRALAEHRSLSAQVVAELERIPDPEAEPPGGKGSFLGLYSGTAVPTDADIAEIRGRLWSRLSREREA